MPDDLFPAPAFDGCDLDVLMEERIDRLIRLALLSDAGLSLDECRAWESLVVKEAS